jgi:predicted transcriptional regulator
MDNLKQVTELIKKEKKVSIAILQKHLDIDELTASRMIGKLMEAKLVGEDWNIYLGGFPYLDPMTRGTGK